MESRSRLAEFRRHLVQFVQNARTEVRRDAEIHDELRESDRERAEELIRDEGWDDLRDKS